MDCLKKYQNKTIVIKFGGALAKDIYIQEFASNIHFLTSVVGAHVVVVHGGGQQIDDALKAKNIPVQKDKVSGLRITSLETLETMDPLLVKMNGHITALFNRVMGSCAVGMAGYHHGIFSAYPVGEQDDYTGVIHSVDSFQIQNCFQSGLVPVFYPVCFNTAACDGEETRLNVNADNVAAQIAITLNADRLIICSDIDGVKDEHGMLIPEILTTDVDRLINSGVVTGGMIPKLSMVANAADKMHKGAGVVILNGMKPHAILNELSLDKGCGTLILSP
jgi:acetylglutamate kinase